MKFCTNCGTKLNDDDMFCYNCGTKCVSFNAPKEEKKEEVVAPKVDPSIEEKEKAEEAKRQEEARLAEDAKQKEEEAKRQAEEARLAEEGRLKAEEEAKRKAEEEVRLAEERKQKEQRLNEIENKRKEKEAEKDRLNQEDAALKDEENQLRKELNLPIEEEPEPAEEKPAPVKEELKKEEKPASNNKGKAFLLEPDEFNSPTLLFHAVVFFGALILISLIYWLVGSFTGIHIAVRIVLFLVSLGTMVLPLIEAIKLTIYMIKNKRINLFLIIILSIIQVLSWVFVFLNMAAIF